jgi:hypothetical protein
MMYKISKVMNRPCMEEAKILVNEKSHAKKATAAVSRKPIGILILAGIRKPTNSVATTKMGSRARQDNRDRVMTFGF